MGLTPADTNNQLGNVVYDIATVSSYCIEDVTSEANNYILKSTGDIKYNKLRDGQKVTFIVKHPNTSSVLINAYGTGEKKAKKFAGSAELSPGDLVEGAVVNFLWIENKGYWEFISTSYEQSGISNYDTFFQHLPFLEVNNKRKVTIKGGSIIRLEVDGVSRFRQQAYDEIIDCESILDRGDHFETGKDYHIFLVSDGGKGTKFVISLNTTYPDGYTKNNSRKIGGFHTECFDVGIIENHPLSGYVAGDILPNSVWCLNHRPISEPEGMVYEPVNDVWVDIYNQSGDGINTKSVYGGTRVSIGHMHFDFVDDLRSIRKTLLTDEEFYAASKGSNQQTSIEKLSIPSPDITGGHKDTKGRRMISNIGCEEMCGLQWTHLYGTNAAGLNNWYAQNGKEGNFIGSALMMLAGGDYNDGDNCGSRARNALSALQVTTIDYGARGKSLPKRMPN